MTTSESINHDMYQTITDDANITVIEKQFGRTTIQDISEALSEYQKLFKAGIASDAEILTLARAFPNSKTYTQAADKINEEPIVVGGPASVELIDREGHLITTNALEKAFTSYMSNFRTRNTMVLHSDVQVGWALPAYISKTGQTFKSGVDEKGLFFVTEIRKDTKIAQRVLDQINDGKLKSYSIAGSATKTQNMQKGLMPYMQVDEMELAEVTVCEKGVNQAAGFDILKGHNSATHSCIDGSCLAHLEKAEDEGYELETIYKNNGDIDFFNSFKTWMEKENLAAKQKKVFDQVTADYNKSIQKESYPKPEDNLIGWVEEYRTPQIEKDTDLVMADSNVPSTPSMGWVDMLKGVEDQEQLVQFLTWLDKEYSSGPRDLNAVIASAMDQAHPGWREDKDAYEMEWAKMKSYITEGYK